MQSTGAYCFTFARSPAVFRGALALSEKRAAASLVCGHRDLAHLAEEHNVGIGRWDKIWASGPGLPGWVRHFSCHASRKASRSTCVCDDLADTFQGL